MENSRLAWRALSTMRFLKYLLWFEIENKHLQKAISDYRDRYNITWNVQSHSPIREYRLFYRKQTTKSYMLTHQIQQHLDKSYENAVVGSQHHYSPPYSTGLSDQWENVVIPENFPEYYPSQPSTFNLNEFHYNSHVNTHHHMSFLIKNLSPATNYEARVQARNDHGWNKLSNVFHFSTRSEGKFPHQHRIETQFPVYLCLCFLFVFFF